MVVFANHQVSNFIAAATQLPYQRSLHNLKASKLSICIILSETPSKQYAPKGDLTWTCMDEERKLMLDKITRDIVKSFLIKTPSTLHHHVPVFTVIDHWVHVQGVLVLRCHQGR